MQRAAILFGVCCVFVQVLSAQSAPTDSLRAIAEARDAQAHFERVRRHTAPFSADEQPPCDVQVGRMCYWNEQGNDGSPREPRGVVTARLQLVARLDTLGRRSPNDDWILGQRVRYMVEAGQDSAAVDAARRCSRIRWSCRVILGFALHSSERFGEAEAQFDSAFALMPLQERCRWNDISLLLDDAHRDAYERIHCGQRDSVEREFWALAQPSFAVRGNDRRTEHFSRVLLADLSEHAVNAYGLSWGPDMRELLIRYGQPRWYTTPVRQLMAELPMPMGHDMTPSFHFAPELSDSGTHWDIYAPRARERYSPAYIDTVTALDVQFAMMKRGDSALVVAVYDGARGNAVLGIPGSGIDSITVPEPVARVRRARSAWKPEMVAMEVLDGDERVDARAREWLGPPAHVAGAPELSTLLLYDPPADSSVRSLDDALAHALAINEIGDRRRLGLYWETYPARSEAVATTRGDSASGAHADSVAPDSAHTTSVTIVRTDGGMLRWLQSALHVATRDSPIAVQWRDSGSGAPVETHSLVVDLTQLPAGNYRVIVDAGRDETHRSETTRDIRLR